MLYLAIAINSSAILWFFIFLENMYAGIVLGLSAVIWFFVFLNKKQNEVEFNFQKQFFGKKIRRLDKCAVLRAQESNGSRWIYYLFVLFLGIGGLLGAVIPFVITKGW